MLKAVYDRGDIPGALATALENAPYGYGVDEAKVTTNILMSPDVSS
jgi:hypothetical protein